LLSAAGRRVQGGWLGRSPSASSIVVFTAQHLTLGVAVRTLRVGAYS